MTPADDGSTDASIFPAHGTGANAVSWAPAVVSTPSSAGPRSPAQGQLTAQKRFVSGGSDNLIRIWVFDDEQKKWVEEEVIKEHEDWVRDVAWAPNIGLPGMYIASASQVRILSSPSQSRVCVRYLTSILGPHSHDSLSSIPNVSMDLYTPPSIRTEQGSPFPRRSLARELVFGGEHPSRQLWGWKSQSMERRCWKGMGVRERLCELDSFIHDLRTKGEQRGDACALYVLGVYKYLLCVEYNGPQLSCRRQGKRFSDI